MKTYHLNLKKSDEKVEQPIQHVYITKCLSKACSLVNQRLTFVQKDQHWGPSYVEFWLESGNRIEVLSRCFEMYQFESYNRKMGWRPNTSSTILDISDTIIPDDPEMFKQLLSVNGGYRPVDYLALYWLRSYMMHYGHVQNFGTGKAICIDLYDYNTTVHRRILFRFDKQLFVIRIRAKQTNHLAGGVSIEATPEKTEQSRTVEIETFSQRLRNETFTESSTKITLDEGLLFRDALSLEEEMDREF